MGSLLLERWREPLLGRRRRRGTTSVLDLIGGTPLVKLCRIGAELRGAEIYAKASGALTTERAILDATSGNTGMIRSARSVGPTPPSGS